MIFIRLTYFYLCCCCKQPKLCFICIKSHPTKSCLICVAGHTHMPAVCNLNRLWHTITDITLPQVPFFNVVCDEAHGGGDCQMLVGYSAVYRVCFGTACFYLMMAIFLIDVKSSQDFRALIHNGLVTALFPLFCLHCNTTESCFDLF